MTQELHAAMDRFQSAVLARSQAEAEGVVDEEFALELVHPGPALVSRSRWFEMLPDYVVHLWQVDDRFEDVDGDVAVVLQRVTMEATVLGESRSGVFVVNDVWRRRSAGWRLWRRQSTPLDAGSMPGT